MRTRCLRHGKGTRGVSPLGKEGRTLLVENAVVAGIRGVNRALLWWSEFDIHPTPKPPPGAEKVSDGINMIFWVCLALAVAAIIAFGAGLTYKRTHDAGTQIDRALAIIAGLIIMSSAAALVTFFIG